MATARLLYSLATYLLTPLLLARLVWRGTKAPAYLRHWSERFGYGIVRPQREIVIWLHAVSVGEVMAARPVVEKLRERLPEAGWVITVSTPTGRERAQAVFGGHATVRYLPYDLSGAVRRFLSQLNPSIALVLETEWWPNLFAQIHERKVPLVLVNVRLSEKSAAGYTRLSSLTRDMLDRVKWAAVQTQDDARRLIGLGMARDKVTVTGSVKLDAPVSPESRESGEQLRQVLGARRPVWIAASTREGEEPLILEAHRTVLKRIPDAGLVLVPRHPERFDEVARLATEAGFVVARRSAGTAPAATWQVYIGDTMGELPVYYCASDAAFVGGSLVPLGGQNMLEPASVGLPIVCGPHTFNFAKVADDLEHAGALTRVVDAAQLGEAIVALLGSKERRTEQGCRAEAYIEANRGATAKVVEGILTLMHR